MNAVSNLQVLVILASSFLMISILASLASAGTAVYSRMFATEGVKVKFREGVRSLFLAAAFALMFSLAMFGLAFISHVVGSSSIG